MDLKTAVLFWVVVLTPLAFLGARYYLRRARRVLHGGEQQVEVGALGWPDLLIATVLSGWFVYVIREMTKPGNAEKAQAAVVSVASLIDAVFMQAVIIGGITWSLYSRGLSLRSLFGFRRYSLWTTCKTGLAAIIAAWPMIMLILIATNLLLGAKAETQPIIDFFNTAVKTQQWGPIIATVLMGVVVAPIAEEFVFRGYLYGVAKRYAGPLAAAIVTSALFAAIHFNALSLPALFFLALCFVVLYELTGSLAVPMVMHACFNAFSLVQTLVAGSVQP